MSRERAKRAAKIVDVRAREVRVCESALAGAIMATRNAADAEREKRAAWMRESMTVPEGPMTASDYCWRDVRLRQIGRHVDTLAAQVMSAKRIEDQRRAELATARVELKKVETWRDGLLLEAANEEAGNERKAVDELAARMARVG